MNHQRAAKQAEDIDAFVHGAARAGKKGAVTFSERQAVPAGKGGNANAAVEALRRCNNGKMGLREVHATGKSGEGFDHNAFAAILKEFGLNEHKSAIMSAR